MQQFNLKQPLSGYAKTGITLMILLCVFALPGHAQVGIKNESPDDCAVLHIGEYGTDKGILIPFVDSIKIIDTENISQSLMFYESKEKAFVFWDSLEWQAINPFTAEVTSDTIYTDKNIVATKEDESEGYKYQVDSGGKRGIPTVPIGGVVIWSGYPGQLPANYKLCDGTGTYYEPITEKVYDIPDLHGRFVTGYNGIPGHDYDSIGNTGPPSSTGIVDGGKYIRIDNNTMPRHAHEHQEHGHTHENDLQLGYFRFTNGSYIGGSVRQNSDKTFYICANDYCTDDTNYVQDPFTHKHSLKGGVLDSNPEANTTEMTGAGRPHENRPPYYVLAYIIRVW